MTVSSKQQVTDFFKKVKKSTADKQQEVTNHAMHVLFNYSPHVDRPDSNFSKGQYDANHKIQINHGNVSPHNLATGSWAASEAIHHIEKMKAKKINSGDRVEIFNTTGYSNYVEFGGPTWRRDGYYAYRIAKQKVKERFSNVLQ